MTLFDGTQFCDRLYGGHNNERFKIEVEVYNKFGLLIYEERKFLQIYFMCISEGCHIDDTIMVSNKQYKEQE